jgi:hypothetical protein
MNSRIFYFGVRKFIYGMPVPRNLERLIQAEVRTFFDGVERTLKDLLAAKHDEAPGRRKAVKKRAGTRSPRQAGVRAAMARRG